jgi:hypothetical protein
MRRKNILVLLELQVNVFFCEAAAFTMTEGEEDEDGNEEAEGCNFEFDLF